MIRPRVSHKVSEYVFDFINNNLLKPSNVLQSGNYVINLLCHFLFQKESSHIQAHTQQVQGFIFHKEIFEHLKKLRNGQQ